MKKTLLLILIMFTLLLSSSVFACSPKPEAPPVIDVQCTVEDSIFFKELTCINDDCSVNITQYNDEFYLNIKDISGNTRELPIYKERVILPKGAFQWVLFPSEGSISDYDEILSYLEYLCVESFDEFNTLESEELIANIRGDINIEPYTEKREDELLESKYDYNSCSYDDYTIVGDWLVVQNEERSYCESVGICGFSSRVSNAKFLGYALTNFNSHMFPYLIKFLVEIAFASIFFRYFIKRKELGLLLKPNKFNVLFTLGLGFALFFMFSILAGIGYGMWQVISWAIGLYIISSLIKYLYLRRKNKF